MKKKTPLLYTKFLLKFWKNKHHPKMGMRFCWVSLPQVRSPLRCCGIVDRLTWSAHMLHLKKITILYRYKLIQLARIDRFFTTNRIFESRYRCTNCVGEWFIKTSINNLWFQRYTLIRESDRNRTHTSTFLPKKAFRNWAWSAHASNWSGEVEDCIWKNYKVMFFLN